MLALAVDCTFLTQMRLEHFKIISTDFNEGVLRIRFKLIEK